MDFSGLGGGVMVALAAVLWLAYLTPTWFRRTEYLATERNAVRLQQTLRVLAETAELPEPVRAEATARDVAAHARRLREEQARLDAIAQTRELAARRQREARIHAVDPDLAPAVRAAARRTRLRRGRLAASALLLVSLVVAGVQITLMASSGIVAGAWVVLALTASGSALAVGMLNRLAAVGRSLVGDIDRIGVQKRRVTVEKAASAPVAVKREWTPVPIPKPLYLERPAPAARVAVGLVLDPAADGGRVVQPLETAVAELHAAAAEAERALREAQDAPEVAPFVRPASKYASMGIIDTSDAPATDLDAVLRRRRTAS